VRRVLLRTTTFVRVAKKFLKKHPAETEKFLFALSLLKEDAWDTKLKTHKLSGELSHLWACSVTYDIRIAFRFVEHEGNEAILLETLGTHDEVY